jgi:hypothetical protein
MPASDSTHDSTPDESSMAANQDDWIYSDGSPSGLQAQDSCNCLQVVSDLLCRSDSMGRVDDTLALGALLSHIQSAFSIWQALFICLAPEHDDEEFLPLIAVSIGAVVRRLKSAAVSQLSLAEAMVTSEPSTHFPDLISCSSSFSFSSLHGPQLSIRSYEIVGKERGLVTGILMSQTLRKIRTVMTSLHNRITPKPSKQSHSNPFGPMEEVMNTAGYSSSSPMFLQDDHVTSHVKLLSQDLDEKVNTVDRILRKTILYNQ